MSFIYDRIVKNNEKHHRWLRRINNPILRGKMRDRRLDIVTSADFVKYRMHVFVSMKIGRST